MAKTAKLARKRLQATPFLAHRQKKPQNHENNVFAFFLYGTERGEKSRDFRGSVPLFRKTAFRAFYFSALYRKPLQKFPEKSFCAKRKICEKQRTCAENMAKTAKLARKRLQARQYPTHGQENPNDTKINANTLFLLWYKQRWNFRGFQREQIPARAESFSAKTKNCFPPAVYRTEGRDEPEKIPAKTKNRLLPAVYRTDRQ